MGGVLPLVPFPVYSDPNQQSVHSNATVSVNGSNVLTGYGANQVTLFINVKNAPSGTNPTLQYTVQEVDPGDGTTIIGTSVSSTVIAAAGIQRITLPMAYGGSIKVSWTVGGTTPSFTGVYATLVGKGIATPAGQEPAVSSGTLTTQGQAVVAPVTGMQSASCLISGTWTGTLIAQASSDGSTWFNIAFIGAPPGLLPTPALRSFVTANGSYQMPGLGDVIQVRVVAYSAITGTVNIAIYSSPLQGAMQLNFSSVYQNSLSSSLNNSTANLASGASFTGGSEQLSSASGILVMFKCDQQCSLQLQQSGDGTNWDATDSIVVNAGVGLGQVFKSVGSYFRIVVTNTGSSTSTYLRLFTNFCPISETLPRSMGPSGGLKTDSGVSTGTWWPALPGTFFGYTRGQRLALQVAADGTLQTYGGVLTDCGSFRDDFVGTSLLSNLTGTVRFVNGSNILSGTGCSFTTQLNRFSYVRYTSDAESTLAQVAYVVDDNNVVLSTNYAGSSASGTGMTSSWLTTTGTGGSISVANTLCSIASGTTSGSNIWIQRGSDYGPMEKTLRFSVSQRIANQTIRLGFVDSFASPTFQAGIELTGTDNTKVTLVARSYSDASNVESVTVSLPGGLTTATLNSLIIDIHNDRVTLYYDPIDGSPRTFLAMCKVHTPPPYTYMYSAKGILNTGVPASSTTLNMDLVYLKDYNIVDVQTEERYSPDADAPVTANVAAAVADTVLVAANKYRKQACVFNDSPAILYLKWGSGASTTSFTTRVAAYGLYELSQGMGDTGSARPYNGQINGYWAAAVGNARVTENT